ncbi:LytTR family two component transcriptional regulator [Balneicella halophila]|uniref:LytTR family two component transcriptional regulator n=1 Tax=Balneicella halophila TaxID=1537566 RepID=A0A7L4UNG3_BALHA|nr:LytTR family DNA-binding domain-containing protein [Balneicella halophila]PVX50723.1 LytTR family two component transcriptional regulator [Balneicella halophila]
MAKVSCLIIDDEPMAQKILQRFVAEVPILELKGVCKNAMEAMDILQTLPVDLLFLDINMPQLSGLDFYKTLPNPPDVIFTTAHPEFAVEGFEVNAVDYLLKPIAFERFLTAVNKIKERQTETKQEALWVKSDKSLHKIPFASIVYIEALGDYVKIYYDETVLLTNETLKCVLERLPGISFLQIHKSYVVNLEKITFISGNQAYCNATALPIGRKYKEEFLEKWKGQ